jgi:hypothetical protein
MGFINDLASCGLEYVYLSMVGLFGTGITINQLPRWQTDGMYLPSVLGYS